MTHTLVRFGDDAREGIAIVRRALEAPAREIAANAGRDSVRP